MLKNIIMGEYCLKLSKRYFTVINEEGKLIFYFMIDSTDYLFDSEPCESISFYPKTISYEPDMAQSTELMNYVSKVLLNEDRTTVLTNLIKMFEMVREQPYFESLCPGDYIRNHKGFINYQDYKYYVENYSRVSENFKKSINVEEPYTQFVNEFKFHCLHTFILSNDKQHVEMSRIEFENLLPNDHTANAYIQVYNEHNKFFCFETKDRLGSKHLFIKTDNKLDLYVRIKN